MKRVLVTGAAGMIGSTLCENLKHDGEVIGLYHETPPPDIRGVVWERADCSDSGLMQRLCDKYVPEAVIHCAALVHRKMGSVSAAAYERFNIEATETLAAAATASNPGVRFIFMSSVAVYGDENLPSPVFEEYPCNPSSDYALSKYRAEKLLERMVSEGKIDQVTVLRLASVYDRGMTFLLDSRVRGPGVFIRYGKGKQYISALARPNLVDFMGRILRSPPEGYTVMNVCDERPYRFEEIIRTFQIVEKRVRPVVVVPLGAVRVAARAGGMIFRSRRRYLHSCANKASLNMVFSNERMLATGFRPAHTLETVFNAGGSDA